MKRVIIAILTFFFGFTVNLNAQHIRMRLDFPVGASIRPVSPAPFAGAVWVGPEWRWQGGRYVYVPGSWVKPRRPGAVWAPGRWKYNRRGYVWMPGRWR